MSRATLRVTADPTRVSMAESIARLSRSTPLFVVLPAAFRDLSRELGSEDAAAERLVEIARSNDRPLLVNFPTGGGRSSSVAVSPPWWSEDRLLGWLGGHHAVLEAELGPIERIGPRRGSGPRVHPRERRRGQGRR